MKQFKSWTIPGPEVPGQVELEEGETLDALSGHLKIFQLKDGHRFSTDDLLVAWYGTAFSPGAARVLDLGTGIGTVGFIAGFRLKGSQVFGIEAQEVSVRLAKKSIAYNGLKERYQIIIGDFRETSVIPNEMKFDLVLGSPPYFPLDSGAFANHEQKVACRFEMRGDVSDYAKAAYHALSSGGNFSVVFPIEPPHQRERVLNAFKENGMILIRQRDVVLKEGEKPLLGLFLGGRACDYPSGAEQSTFVENPLVIRMKTGEVSLEYRAIKLSLGFPP